MYCGWKPTIETGFKYKELHWSDLSGSANDCPTDSEVEKIELSTLIPHLGERQMGQDFEKSDVDKRRMHRAAGPC